MNPTKRYYRPHYRDMVKIMILALTLQKTTRIGNRFTSRRNYDSMEDGYDMYAAVFTIKLHVFACLWFCPRSQQGKACTMHSSRCINDCPIRTRGLAANRLS